MTKKFWGKYASWHEAEAAWDESAKKAEKEHPLKVLKSLPRVPGMTTDTAKNLKWKSLKWMVAKDSGLRVMRHILKRPFSHLYGYLKSLFLKKSYKRDGDFFLYGFSSVSQFEEALKATDTLLVVGFSYCEKPHECPSGRFTDACMHDVENPVCRQCFIGKVVHALPEKRTIPLFIPTIHYIANKIFEIKGAHPNKRVLFLITACEMTLEMFGDWGNMSGISGVGVRLDGRICNTMRAFELSEGGVKPGLTVVLPETQERILALVRHWNSCSS